MDLRLPPLTQVPALSPVSWLPTQPTVLGPIWGNRSRDTSVWGSLFAAPPCSALNRAPSSPRRRTRPAGKLLPSCGGASSLPSNAPSNRVTSAPSEALQRPEGRTCRSQAARRATVVAAVAATAVAVSSRLKSDIAAKVEGSCGPRAVPKQVHALSPAYPTKVLTYSLTTSKVAYFKRKYAEEEDLHQDYHGYFPKHLILPEDRTCILKLSLEKLRFLEDPEIYLRRSVLINNLLRKIHLETEKESYEYFKDAPCYKTAYSDTRKRLKFMVQECCSQSLYYEELHSYHIVPYASENAIYGMGYTSSHLEQNSQLLIYKMN
ncbi:uncharacterized protein [Castor canadensis]|uniref:Uncharacterized protein n=2 Tax=Castor canadensis TaxID=51338 RepID=A0AC58M0Z1_CASCN